MYQVKVLVLTPVSMMKILYLKMTVSEPVDLLETGYEDGGGCELDYFLLGV